MNVRESVVQRGSVGQLIIQEKKISLAPESHALSPFAVMLKPTNTGITSKGTQRHFCLGCQQTFTESFDTLYYRRQLKQEEVHTILQSHCEGSSLRGVARISGRAYGTVVALVRDASQKAQMVHNAFVQQVKTIAITADELWSFIQKNKNTVCLGSLRWATAGLA